MGFSAEQNAAVAAGAERYYRAMVGGQAESWNVRDVHLQDTLDRLLDFHGTKAVVWEHNTHAGDARATDMAGAGMVNVGQLARERHGDDDVVVVGFGGSRRCRRGVAVGRADGADAGAARPRRHRRGAAARAAGQRQRAGLPDAAAAGVAAPAQGPPRSASSTRRSASAGATTSRPCWAAATTRSSTSTTPARCDRCTWNRRRRARP